MTFDSHSSKYSDCFRCVSSGFDSYIHPSFLYENLSLWRFKREKKKLVVWPYLNTVYPKKRLSLSRGYKGKIRITHRINRTNEAAYMFLSKVKQNVERSLWHWQEFSSHKAQTHILLSLSNKKVPGVDVRSRAISTHESLLLWFATSKSSVRLNILNLFYSSWAGRVGVLYMCRVTFPGLRVQCLELASDKGSPLGFMSQWGGNRTVVSAPFPFGLLKQTNGENVVN